MHALPELRAQPLDELFADGQQAGVAGVRRGGEQGPAEPVSARLGVALDEALCSERLERARHLALVLRDQLGDPVHPQPVRGQCLVRAKSGQDRQTAAQTS